MRCLALNTSLALLLALAASASRAAAVVKDGDIEWGAQRYSRSGATNTAKGSGGAWVKSGGQSVQADEIEMDFTTNRAVATGNVHIVEPGRDIWCSRLDYNLHGEDAILENMKMVAGSVVITGGTARKVDNRHFEVEDGTYSNCNVDLSKDQNITECPFDWKLQGRRFSVSMGEYAQFYDVLVYAKSLPVLYTPYLIVPVKSGRQSGLLMPTMPFATNTGQGFSLPFFWAMAQWQDLTLTPTFYSKAGLHLGGQYRYYYSPLTHGTLDFFGLSNRFLPIYRTQTNDVAIDEKDRSSSKLLGAIGEGAINLNNQVSLGGRMTSLQVLRWMSSPIYNYEFPSDVNGDLGYLRSEVNFTAPGDEWLAAARVQSYQSLVIPENPLHPKLEPIAGVVPAPGTLTQSPYAASDRGALTELPTLTVAKTNAPLLGNLLTYEADVEVTNFYRADATDPLPLTGATPNTQDYYLRTGRRLQAEPRLVASIPMPLGIQLQPVLRAGGLAYQFDYPNIHTVERGYSSIEIPLSFYLSKVFHTEIGGYETISHVFQPRVILGASLLNSPEPNDPFFFRNVTYNSLPNGASQVVNAPRFDYNDQISNYQFVRFELINRLRRWGKSGNERFFLLQLAEQLNVRTDPYDPRYLNQTGPVELLAEVRIWRLYAQIQALYQLQSGIRQPAGVETAHITPTLNGQPDLLYNGGTHEYDVSGTLTYEAPNQDKFSLSSLFSNRVDRSLNQQTATVSLMKKLPTFFDVDAAAEYSLREGRLVSYTLGFTFQAKPRSCWYLSTHFGTSGSNNQPFFNLGFSLMFGTISDMHTS